MPEIAKKVTVNLAEQKVYVDGVEFPWLLDESGPEVVQYPALGVDIGIVSLPIFADQIEVIPDPDATT